MRRLRALAGYSLDAIAVIAVFVVMYLTGYGSDSPLWCLAVGVFGAWQMQPGFQRRLARGDLQRYVAPRMALLMATATAFIYATGWGAMMLCGLSLVVALHMRLSGPQVWRQGLLWAALGAVAGQGAVAAGWAESYIAAPAVHVVALGGVVLSALLIRTIGITGEQRQHAEGNTRSTERRYRALIRDSADVFAIYHSDGTLGYVSPAIRQLTGLSPDPSRFEELKDCVHPDDLPVGRDLLRRAAGPGAQLEVAEIRVRGADGDYRWTECTVRDLTGDPDLRGYVINIRDIHDRKSIQERLAHAATHDELTGLVNRAEFGRALDVACAAGETAVLFVDLDGFKQVNDTYGHEAGDALLIAAAEVLVRWSPRGATVGRFGGDEFGVVVPWPSGGAEQAAERILAGLSEPVVFAGQELVIRASVGVAVSAPGASSGAGELLRRADLAMYEAKRAGVHGFEVAPPVRRTYQPVLG